MATRWHRLTDHDGERILVNPDRILYLREYANQHYTKLVMGETDDSYLGPVITGTLPEVAARLGLSVEEVR